MIIAALRTSTPAVPRARRVALALGSLTLATTLLLSGSLAPSPARADDTIGVSGVPADGTGTPDGRTRFTYSADPGQHLADFYLARNAGSTVQTFTVLATDAFNDDDGDFALLETKEEATDVGSWVRFDSGENRIQFDLAPGESRLVPFTLDVPAEAGPGDHVGGVLASVVTPGDEVTIDRRLGTRLYVRVSGELQPALAVGGLTADYLGDWWNPFAGTVRMRYTVENVGNIALAANVSLGITTWFGIPATGERGDGVPELLPRNTRSYETEVPGIAAWGFLNPWVKLNPFVEGGDTDKRLNVGSAARDTVLIAIPWPLVILLGLLGLFFVFRAWRRRVDADRAAAWMAHTEAEARRRVASELGADAGHANEGDRP